MVKDNGMVVIGVLTAVEGNECNGRDPGKYLVVSMQWPDDLCNESPGKSRATSLPVVLRVLLFSIKACSSLLLLGFGIGTDGTSSSPSSSTMPVCTKEDNDGSVLSNLSGQL